MILGQYQVGRHSDTTIVDNTVIRNVYTEVWERAAKTPLGATPGSFSVDEDGDARTRQTIVGGRPVNKNHPTKRIAFDNLNDLLRTSQYSDPSPAHRTVKAGRYRNQAVHILKGPKLATIGKPGPRQHIKTPQPRKDSSRYKLEGKRFHFPNLKVWPNKPDGERKKLGPTFETALYGEDGYNGENEEKQPDQAWHWDEESRLPPPSPDGGDGGSLDEHGQRRFSLPTLVEVQHILRAREVNDAETTTRVIHLWNSVYS
jgi:hypothetical protein